MKKVNSCGKKPHLRLRDGKVYRFYGCDDLSLAILRQFAEAMRLEYRHPIPGESRICIFSGHPGLKYPRDKDNSLQVFLADPDSNRSLLAIQLMRIASVVVLDAEERGGVILHSALVEKDGFGFLLAAQGGVGKTTASGRLEYPWRSLCDDMALIVRDSKGGYWAHPWPTWSRWMLGNQGESWDVQRAVPLRAVFFLAQSETDRAEPLGAGKAATLLVESAEQVSMAMFRNFDETAVRARRLRRFDNICDLARALPCFELSLSLTGAFWKEMDRVLDGGSIPQSLQVSLEAL